MFICPVCKKEFETEQRIQDHFLACWKEAHPYHKPKPAPRSADITTREVSDDMADFFSSLRKDDK